MSKRKKQRKQAAQAERPARRIIICAPANAPLMTLGSRFGYICTRCACEVMLAPSGQEYIAAHPGTRVVCIDCFGPSDIEGSAKTRVAAQTVTILATEMLCTVTNPRSRGGSN